jgi:hypothetical protein
MTARIFVVLATLIVGLLAVIALIVFEEVPEPAAEKEVYDVQDRFLDMRYSAATRRSNLSAFGLPDTMVDKVEARIGQLIKDDRNADLIKAMKAAPDVGGDLCVNGTDLPSRYRVTGVLLSGERGQRREVMAFSRVRNRFAKQEGYGPQDLEGLYAATELIPNAPADAYALNIAALLLGKEIDRLDQVGDFSGGVFGAPSLVAFLNRKAEVELDMVEFFAQMHYLHEVARDPKNEFCGVRAGGEFSGGD